MPNPTPALRVDRVNELCASYETHDRTAFDQLSRFRAGQGDLMSVYMLFISSVTPILIELPLLNDRVACSINQQYFAVIRELYAHRPEWSV